MTRYSLSNKKSGRYSIHPPCPVLRGNSQCLGRSNIQACLGSAGYDYETGVCDGSEPHGVEVLVPFKILATSFSSVQGAPASTATSTSRLAELLELVAWSCAPFRAPFNNFRAGQWEPGGARLIDGIPSPKKKNVQLRLPQLKVRGR